MLAIAPVGFGKAVCGQTAIQWRLSNGSVKRVLIIAPKAVAQHVWGEEWRKWEHLEAVGLAVGDESQRMAVINDPVHRIVAITTNTVPWLCASPELLAQFDGLLIDETSKFKQAGGVWVRRLRTKLAGFSWRAGLSATPVAESGIDLYSQILLIDDGATLGRQKRRFQLRFFYSEDWNQRKWQFVPGGAELLAEAVAPSVYVCEGAADYAAELPPFEDVVLPVNMPAEAQDLSRQLVKDYAAQSRSFDIEAPNAAVVVGKLQQIARGALIDNDGEVHWIHTEKFDALELWMESHPGTRVLISYEYIFELEELQRRLPGAGLVSSRDDVVKWNARLIDVLIVHPKSAGHGLNLQAGGNVLINLGPFWSADQWAQLIGRLHRRGQTEPVKRVTFVAVHPNFPSIEEDILVRLDGKQISEKGFMTLLTEKARI